MLGIEMFFSNKSISLQELTKAHNIKSGNKNFLKNV